MDGHSGPRFSRSSSPTNMVLCDIGHYIKTVNVMQLYTSNLITEEYGSSKRSELFIIVCERARKLAEGDNLMQ